MSDEPMAQNAMWRADLRRDFDRLAGLHRDRIYSVCLRIVRDPQRAEELTQDALLTAFDKLDDYEGRSAFGTWVCGIGKMLALNDVRRRREMLTEDGVLDAEDPGLVALRALRQQEREELLRQAASELLDPIEQEVVYLRYSEQMSRSTIAEVLGLSDDNEVRVMLQRCKRRLEKGLRQRLEQLGHGTSFIRTTW
ncbi:MAG: sigma-70 family RNA polymerase sigma factor [Alphaproteobacteria bacterium]|nr:sigma-70 family RNA polymerase sigma factor [Alphaproteobacteria bacterium]